MNKSIYLDNAEGEFELSAPPADTSAALPGALIEIARQLKLTNILTAMQMHDQGLVLVTGDRITELRNEARELLGIMS